MKIVKCDSCGNEDKNGQQMVITFSNDTDLHNMRVYARYDVCLQCADRLGYFLFGDKGIVPMPNEGAEKS